MNISLLSDAKISKRLIKCLKTVLEKALFHLSRNEYELSLKFLKTHYAILTLQFDNQ